MRPRHGPESDPGSGPDVDLPPDHQPRHRAADLLDLTDPAKQRQEIELPDDLSRLRLQPLGPSNQRRTGGRVETGRRHPHHLLSTTGPQRRKDYFLACRVDRLRAYRGTTGPAGLIRELSLRTTSFGINLEPRQLLRSRTGKQVRRATGRWLQNHTCQHVGGLP